MIEQDPNLLPEALQATKTRRMRECLSPAVVEVNAITTYTRNRRYMNAPKMKLSSNHVRDMQSNIESIDPRKKAKGLSDLNDVLERLESKIFQPKKRRN